MPRVRAAGPEQNRTTGPPATASWEGRTPYHPASGQILAPAQP